MIRRLSVLLIFLCLLTGCAGEWEQASGYASESTVEESVPAEKKDSLEGTSEKASDEAKSDSEVKGDRSGSAERRKADAGKKAASGGSEREKRPCKPSDFPVYDGVPYVEVNDNHPFFWGKELKCRPFEQYADLDELGRCGTADACLSPELMPDEKRGSIGHVRPSGWQTKKYDFLPDRYLYNRCHLIAFMLAGENDNEKNLITGTRYMNVDGMLDFESRVADYIEETGGWVRYRVTPCYEGKDLVAGGVLLEARAIDSDAINFCVYCYNVQPGVDIDYSDGDSEPSEDAASYYENGRDEAKDSTVMAGAERKAWEKNNKAAGTEIPESTSYVLNTNTKKFHLPDCASVQDMSPGNTEFFEGTREEAVKKGYSPCGRCHP